MGKVNPGVDAYIAKSADFAKPILKHIRSVVHAGCPEVQEELKWGFPHFMYKGILCSMASFKAHCAFGFWKGELLAKTHKALADTRESAMGEFGRCEPDPGLECGGGVRPRSVVPGCLGRARRARRLCYSAPPEPTGRILRTGGAVQLRLPRSQRQEPEGLRLPAIGPEPSTGRGHPSLSWRRLGSWKR
ncbi:MAG: DUF1801 domain-containing protein, partial [Acidobacteria bacterium]|nr:DUF1801 domain-containing protein [Acidobacteriota bacterium]